MQGRWQALTGTTGMITWFAAREDSDALMFSTADVPIAIPALIQFQEPVLSDTTHEHTFYFREQSQYVRACQMLGIAQSI